MKPVTSVALLLGLISAALAQTETLAPSPTESVGCEPHGDHWHCDGPRVTSATDVAAPTNTEAAPATTSSATHNDDDDHDDHDHDDDDHDDHSDAAGTASLKPSPTESYGCEPHGDHWHCAGPVTASGASTLLTSTTPTGTDGAAATTAATGAAVPRYQGVGLGVAGLVVAMAL